MNAKLIVLEGLDGAGKSTQIELIKKYFEEHNLKYAFVHYPIYGDNEASSVIAAYLRGEYGKIDEVDPVFVANMYAMDRFLHLPKLTQLMAENDVVLLDRYVFSNMAFQGAKHKNPTQQSILREWIYELEFGFLELPWPDLNIFFDVPIEEIEKRLTDRVGDNREYLEGKVDIHEADLEFQKRVRTNYLALEDYPNFVITKCVAEFESMETIQLSPEQIFKNYEDILNFVLFETEK